MKRLSAIAMFVALLLSLMPAHGHACCAGSARGLTHSCCDSTLGAVHGICCTDASAVATPGRTSVVAANAAHATGRILAAIHFDGTARCMISARSSSLPQRTQPRIVLRT
ncbi:MAG TPA: hypothetical protein VMT38_01930 [Terracidiphilus sp.]|nr:hypothetical protein [Terracidiphilus sp.]